MESENIGLNRILAFNSWASSSKLPYTSGPQFAKFLKPTSQGKDQMRLCGCKSFEKHYMLAGYILWR